MGLISLTDKELLSWLNEQLELRKKLSEHCKINQRDVAYDFDVSREMLIYDVSDFKRLAKLCNTNYNIELVESDCSAISTRLSFNFEGVRVHTYATEWEVNNE